MWYGQTIYLSCEVQEILIALLLLLCVDIMYTERYGHERNYQARSTERTQLLPMAAVTVMIGNFNTSNGRLSLTGRSRVACVLSTHVDNGCGHLAEVEKNLGGHFPGAWVLTLTRQKQGEWVLTPEWALT